jgi:hypothetical protein
LTYVVGIIGNGKYELDIYEADPVIVAAVSVVVVVVAVPVPVPRTAPVVVAVCKPIVPVQVAPMGQHLQAQSVGAANLQGHLLTLYCEHDQLCILTRMCSKLLHNPQLTLYKN